MKLILQYIRQYSGLFGSAIAFLIIETTTDLLQPALMSYIVDDGVKCMDVQQILYYGKIMFAISLMGAFAAVIRNLLSSYVSQKIGKKLRSDLFRKVQTLSMENIDRLQPASIITRITNDVTQIQNFISGCMRILVKAPVTCIGAIALVSIQMPQQIPVLVVILVISAALVVTNMKLGYPLYDILQQKLDRLNCISREFLSSIRVVKAFQAQDQEKEKFGIASHELAEANTSVMRVMAVFIPFINLSVNFGTVVLLWLSQNGNSVEIGRVMASVNYMAQILFAMGLVSNILNSAVRAAASSGRIREMLEEIPVQDMESRTVCPKWEGKIVFENVSFSYAGSGKEILRQVSFCINPGETIGIIGPTGSGKTTLVNLIPGFYDAVHGKVKIDGNDVTQINQRELRMAVSVVTQKAILFTGTILENLKYGREEAKKEEIVKAAQIACADSFIRESKAGYDTLLGQGGVNLSGGQRQRLSLARALVRNPKILILDDCTSALDAETEQKVLSGLYEQLKGVTVLLISQRIAAVRKADRILCIDNGIIQGFASHSELMESCEIYQEIYASQIGGE